MKGSCACSDHPAIAAAATTTATASANTSTTTTTTAAVTTTTTTAFPPTQGAASFRSKAALSWLVLWPRGGAHAHLATGDTFHTCSESLGARVVAPQRRAMHAVIYTPSTKSVVNYQSIATPRNTFN